MGRNFSIIHEKIVQCRLVCMCPTMDLVASLHVDGQLSVHRTMGWQRSFTLSLEDMGNRTFACITWSPNGKTFAVGYTDGTIQLFGVETGAEECSLAFHEGRPLAALTWVAQQPRQAAASSRADEEADQLAEVAAAYANRCEHVLGSSDRLPGGTSGASRGSVGGRSVEYGSQAEDSFDLLQGIKERPVSVLASADTSGVVVLSVCGAYRLVTIDLKCHRTRISTPKGKGRASPGGRLSPSKVDSPMQASKRRSSAQNRRCGVGWFIESGKDVDGIDQGPALRPLQLTLSADLSLLSAIVEVDGNIELIQVDLPLLWRRRHDLKPLAMKYTAFRAILGRLAAYVPRLPQLWNSSLQSLEKRLSNLEELLPRFGYDEGITPRDELLLLVTCGYASNALIQFLSTSHTETQLARMRKAIDTGTGQVESMLRGDVSFLARTLLFRACELHRSAIVYHAEGSAEHASELGPDPAPVKAFLEDCKTLCVSVEQTLREVQISRSRLQYLLTWLEQVTPTVTDSSAVDNAEDDDRNPPSLALANSVLSILREPLPSEQPCHGGTPVSRVESMIGTSVPGLCAKEGPKGPSVVLGEDPTLAARTIREQVQHLRESVTEIFKAPRSRLSRVVGNVRFARLCAHSVGGGKDLVRTRAAAKAAAAARAASSEMPPLVSMRACMCFQDKLPAGCVGGDSGGFVLAAVAPDNRRNAGLDVVWIVVVPVVAGTPSRAPSSTQESDDYNKGNPVQVTGIRSPTGFQVRQVVFYGSVPGVPTQNEERLAVILEPIGDRDRASSLHLIALDDLSFTPVGTLSSFDDDGETSPARKARTGGVKDIAGAARGQSVSIPLMSEVISRSRELPEHVKGVTVALSGARGMACAVSSSKQLFIFDLEEDEEDKGATNHDEGEQDEDESR